MSKDGMLAAVATAAGLNEEEAKKVDINATFIKQHFNAVATELIGEGAKAERDRIIGIEKAAMPGHDAIIKAHKADSGKTPADAALAVIAAENATRTSRLDALDKDEKQVNTIRSETATVEPGNKAPGAGLEGEPKWKAEWAADENLRAEFTNETTYLAFKKAEARGGVKVLRGKASA